MSGKDGAEVQKILSEYYRVTGEILIVVQPEQNLHWDLAEILAWFFLTFLLP